jgi:hypothetical protein
MIYECNCGCKWSTDNETDNEFIGNLIECPLCQKGKEKEETKEKTKRKYTHKKEKLDTTKEQEEDVVPKRGRGRIKKWTTEIMDWLDDNAPDMTKDELIKGLKRKFNLKTNKNGLGQMLYKYKIEPKDYQGKRKPIGPAAKKLQKIYDNYNTITPEQREILEEKRHLKEAGIIEEEPEDEEL